MGEKWPVIWTESCDFHAYTFGFFHMPQICDMGQMALLPFRRRRAEDSKPASAGFESANLGTKGQHATSRPPKPLRVHVSFEVFAATKFNKISVPETLQKFHFLTRLSARDDFIEVTSIGFHYVKFVRSKIKSVATPSYMLLLT